MFNSNVLTKISILATILVVAFVALSFINVNDSTFSFETPTAYALGGDGGGDGGSGGGSGGDCCGTGGGGGVVTPPDRDPDPIIPVCVINAAPSTITASENSTLTWTTTNAITASIDQSIGGVAIGINKTRVVTPANTITYRMTVTSSTGNTSFCNTTVTVNPPVVVPLPECVLTATPSTINAGGTSRLTWTSQNTAGIGTIDRGVGDVDPRNTAGFRNVSPTATTTYTLTVRNSAGVEATCDETVRVVPPTPNAPICESFTAEPATINRGQSSTLTWDTTNTKANSVAINNGLGGGRPVDGNVNVSPLVTTTYTLTATGLNDAPLSCPVVVTVVQPNTPISCADNVSFTASDYSIEEGQSSVLTWDTRGGIDSVRINNGVNSTALDGSESVSPRSDTTYTLTATKGSDSVNCPLTINVDEDNGGGGGGGSSAPKCTLKISDNKISLGERITIKWDTTRATEVTLKDNHGKTLIDTDDKSSSEKKDLYDGEITLRPEKDTTYTLVAEKGSRDKTCKVEVDVEDTIVVTQVRDQQPLVTGIALTNVPYTGFEAGPFMTSVFYTLLAAWALYMAYVLVGRRNGASASAFTPSLVTADIVPSATMFPEKVTTAPVFYQSQTTTAPVATATVGYEAHVDAATAIEAQAHAAHVLLSSDATAYFIAATVGEDKEAILAGVLAAAKASYPSEDGWVVISADRMIELASKY